MSVAAATTRTYKAAVDAIYKTQVFGEELRRAYSERKSTVATMTIYLRRLGLLSQQHQEQDARPPQGPVADLRVLHVTGTKGKGSTCAYIDSILRAHGARTVLFTSPHLVRINERIRVDGRPISDESLAIHFWDLWDRLQQADISEGEPPPVPGFFRLLTLLGFWVAVQEKVDALVLEVGVGGRYDATNVVPSPVACVVNTLDLDHTDLLGKTIEEIAWEKGGIMKKGAPCFLAPQTPGALKVLQECAREASCPLYTVEPLPPSPPPARQEGVEEGEGGGGGGRGWGETTRLGIRGDAQRINAALALAVARVFLSHHHNEGGGGGGGGKGLLEKEGLLLPSKDEEAVPVLSMQPLLEDHGGGDDARLMRKGLEDCRWPGRCQRVEWADRPGVTVLLDGAHTEQSMAQAVRWLDEEHSTRGGVGTRRRKKRAMVFNCSAEKNVPELFRHLVNPTVGGGGGAGRFDRVVFCPASGVKPSLASVRSPEDILSATAEQEGLDLPRLLHICSLIREIDEGSSPVAGGGGAASSSSPPSSLPWQHSLRGVWLALTVDNQMWRAGATDEDKGGDSKIRSLEVMMSTVVVQPSVKAALDAVSGSEEDKEGVDVFVTGSLYVVGDALAIVEPP